MVAFAHFLTIRGVPLTLSVLFRHTSPASLAFAWITLLPGCVVLGLHVPSRLRGGRRRHRRQTLELPNPRLPQRRSQKLRFPPSAYNQQASPSRCIQREVLAPVAEATSSTWSPSTGRKRNIQSAASTMDYVLQRVVCSGSRLPPSSWRRTGTLLQSAGDTQISQTVAGDARGGAEVRRT